MKEEKWCSTEHLSIGLCHWGTALANRVLVPVSPNGRPLQLIRRRHLCKLSAFLPITKDKCVCVSLQAANDCTSLDFFRSSSVVLHCRQEWTDLHKLAYSQVYLCNLQIWMHSGKRYILSTWALVIRLSVSFICKAKRKNVWGRTKAAHASALDVA